MGKNNADFRGRRNPNYKHGYAPNGKRASFYNTWQNMKARCMCASHPKYSRYGGRGIRVCDEWLSIDGFSKWALANGWQEGLSIDRIDNNGDYCPENCRWVSVATNSKYKSTTKLTLDQAIVIRQRISEGENEYALAEEYGVVHGTIWFIKNHVTHKED